MSQTVQVEVGALAPEAFTKEFLKLRNEGWEPDLDEFLKRVPESLREEVFRQIDEALANPPEEQDPHLAPRTEVVVEAPETSKSAAEEPGVVTVPPARWLVRTLMRVVPADIREPFLYEWLAARHERLSLGMDRAEVSLLSALELLGGVAQHAPLRERAAERTASGAHPLVRWSWKAWICTGPCLFAGTAFGSFALFGCGLALLATAMTAALRHRDDAHEEACTLCNAVLAGTTLALTTTVLLLCVMASVVVASIALGGMPVVAFGFHVLSILATLATAAITVSTWAPEPWCPRLLVRVQR